MWSLRTGMVIGLVGVVVLALLTHEAPSAWLVPAVPAAAWMYLVVFGPLVAFSSYMYLLVHASAALATSYAFVNPVMLLGMAIGGECITAWEWAAIDVILLGVVLIFGGKRPPVDASRSASSA